MPRAIDSVTALFDALADFDHSAIAAILHDELRSFTFQNDYIGVFTVADGKIKDIREYANPLVSARMYEDLAAAQQT